MEFYRTWFQFLAVLITNSYWAFPFTKSIYQGPMKVICAPGLNCYSCPAAAMSCPIGSIQQMLLSVRLSWSNGQAYLALYLVGAMGIIGSIFGRMICGWACPFGLFQELLYKIPSKKFGIPRVLRFLKYAILALTVFILPLTVVNEMGLGLPWFCKFICPAGTLEAGFPMLLLQPSLQDIVGTLFYSKVVVLIAFIIWSIIASRPFCRTTCPLGAFYGLFKNAKMVKLVLDESKCTQCNECHPVCPMGVKFNESPNDSECITCLKCMHEGCQFGAIQLQIGGIPVHSPDIRKKSTNPSA